MQYKYIIDTKLVAYYLIQRGRSLSEIFNKIADMLHYLKKRGEVFPCFDLGHSDFRLSEQSYYKGQRRTLMKKKTKAEQLAHKMFNEDYVKLYSIFQRLTVKPLGIEGVEADDIASLLCEVYKNDPDVKVTLLTGDFDYSHMVVDADNIRMFDFPKDTMYYKKDMIAKYGLDTRRKFSVLKCLVGDKSDNIFLLNQFAKTKGGGFYEKMYKDFVDPTDDQIIEGLEEYMSAHPKATIHANHLKDKRTTVREAYECNMRIADPFTDYNNMTFEQADTYDKLIAAPYNTKKITTQEFFDITIEVFGYPVQLSAVAMKIYGVE